MCAMCSISGVYSQTAYKYPKDIHKTTIKDIEDSTDDPFFAHSLDVRGISVYEIGGHALIPK